MKIKTIILNTLFPVLARKNKQLLMLHNELRETIDRLQQETLAQKFLLKEIEYLYSIFIHNNGYRYQLLVLPNVSPLTFTVVYDRAK